ncbi:MAG: hypothetical protein J7647_28240 [Cyanobacteria bacterium SBLK]|nr:hypothetical protein [Cyanobacteria bacterium SBLK]
MKRLFLIIITIISLFILGGTSALADAIVPTPSIVGNYTTNYGGRQLIGNKRWIMKYKGQHPFIFTYTSVDNPSQTIIAENTYDEGDGFDYTGKFSQFNWTYDDSDDLWYCQQVYDADTAEDAAAQPSADSSDPANGGCGIPTNNFPWSQLIPVSNS